MPVFGDDLETHALASSNYGYSATRIGDLGATEYTLTTIAADCSGSVAPFRAEMEACIGQIVQACRRSPRADNLLMRLVRFADRMTEVHGFKPLMDCAPDTYQGSLPCGGMTALYDTAANGVSALADMGEKLIAADYSANGILFVITDGVDNASTLTPASVQAALGDAVRGERLESLVSILIGVNVTDQTVARNLAAFAKGAGFSQYMEMGSADAASLAKLAAFVSKSISAQSQALGTGGPSQALTF